MPRKQPANIPKLKKLFNSTNQIIDPRPIMAVTMKSCGASYREISEVFGISKQMAMTIYKNAIKELNNG